MTYHLQRTVFSVYSLDNGVGCSLAYLADTSFKSTVLLPSDDFRSSSFAFSFGTCGKKSLRMICWIVYVKIYLTHRHTPRHTRTQHTHWHRHTPRTDKTQTREHIHASLCYPKFISVWYLILTSVNSSSSRATFLGGIIFRVLDDTTIAPGEFLTWTTPSVPAIFSNPQYLFLYYSAAKLNFKISYYCNA